MSPIGGYFELELFKGEEYHKNAIRLNTARNAFEYILRAKHYKKVYVPFYTCEVMLEPIKKLFLNVEFYHIDNTFRPVFDFSKMKTSEVFLYTNYFGVCDTQVVEVSEKCNNLIVDNAQAFFSKPLKGVDTFYSPRKSFGLPDGAYLYTDKILEDEFETDISYQRFEHLLGRIDLGAEKFYKEFMKNDDSFIKEPIKKMSTLTQRLLCSINYQNAADRRRDNFKYLDSVLSKQNIMSFSLKSSSVPLIYPYFVKSGIELRKKLIANKIYVPTYWPNVLEHATSDSLEYNLTENLVCLPLDQRYDLKDMNKILGNV